MTTIWEQFPDVVKVQPTTATTVAEASTDILTQLCDVLSTADVVADYGYDPVRDLVAIANSTSVDVFNPRSGKRIGTIAVGEVANKVSMYDGAVWVATPTKGIYYADYQNPDPKNAGAAGLVDGILWSTAQDTNSLWTGPVYTPPALFLIEAGPVGWEVWDLATGTPVSDNTGAEANLKAISYLEGMLVTGTSATGGTEYDWALNTTQTYTTATTPGIDDDVVSAVATDLQPGSAVRDVVNGLLTPTLAFATGAANAKGVGTVILENNTAADYNQPGSHGTSVCFSDHNLLWGFSASAAIAKIPVLPGGSVDVLADPSARVWDDTTVPQIDSNTGKFCRATGGTRFTFNETAAAGFLNDGAVSETDALYTRISSTFATAPMQQPFGAWGNDTDTSPVGYPFDFDEDFDAPPEVVRNEQFDRTALAPWNDFSTGTGTATVNGAELALTDGATGADLGQATILEQATPLGWYQVTVSADEWAVLRVGSTEGAGDVFAGSAQINGGEITFSFQNLGITEFWVLYRNTVAPFSTQLVDYSVLTYAPALDAWTSVNVDFSVTAGVLRLENNTAAAGYLHKSFTAQVGVANLFTWEDPQSDPDSAISLGTAPGLADIQALTTAKSFSYTPGVATVYANCTVNSAVNGADAYFDNLLSQRDPVDNLAPDNSGQANPMTPVGEVVKIDSCDTVALEAL